MHMVFMKTYWKDHGIAFPFTLYHSRPLAGGKNILIIAEIKSKAFCLKPKSGGVHLSHNFCQYL